MSITPSLTGNWKIYNKTAWHFPKLVLWIMDSRLVQKARAIFSTNTIQTETKHNLVTRVFPRFRQFACFYFEF